MCTGLFESRRSRLGLLKSTFNAENFIRKLSWSIAILAQFTLEMHVAAQNCEKFTKTLILGVQGHSKSSTLTFIRSSSPELVMISSTSVPICNHFHIRWANNGRMMLYKGVPLFLPSFVEISFTQWHEILSQNTRDSKLSYGENQKTLSHLGLERYQDVTDTTRHKDRITIVNTCYSYASSRIQFYCDVTIFTRSSKVYYSRSSATVWPHYTVRRKKISVLLFSAGKEVDMRGCNCFWKFFIYHVL